MSAETEASFMRELSDAIGFPPVAVLSKARRLGLSLWTARSRPSFFQLAHRPRAQPWSHPARRESPRAARQWRIRRCCRCSLQLPLRDAAARRLLGGGKASGQAAHALTLVVDDRELVGRSWV